MNEVKSALFIYTILMLAILLIRPKFLFDKENKLKRFGLGTSPNTTIFPLWVISIIFAILSYYLVVILGMMKNSNTFSLFGSSNANNQLEMPQQPQSVNYNSQIPVQSQVPMGYGQPTQQMVQPMSGQPMSGQYGGNRSVQFVNPIQPRRF